MRFRQAVKLMTRFTPRQKWGTLETAARITEKAHRRGSRRLRIKWDLVKSIAGPKGKVIPSRHGWKPPKFYFSNGDWF